LDTRFCWTELCTSESEKAVRFYARLLGWESVPQPVSTRSGQTIDYTLFSLRGRNVGGMYPMVAVQRRQGMRPHWLSYAFVEDAASCATRATKLGAVLLAGPLNVFDLGRLCILRDPTGACFGAWQSMRLDSTFQTRNEPGFAAWFEHVSENVRQAADFYGSLFGWSPRSSEHDESRILCEQGGTAVAGLSPSARYGASLTPQWLTFFQADDCDASCQKIATMQGAVIVPPIGSADAERIGVVSDPQGAAFGLLSRAGQR